MDGVAVVINGQSTAGPFTQTYSTDSGGRLVLDRAVIIEPPALLDITAPAFIGRSTYLRSAGETVFSLWPRTSSTGLDEELSETLVYSASTCPAQNTGLASLRRVSSSTRQVSIGFSESLQDSAAQDVHIEAIGRLNEATGGFPSYVFEAAPAAGGVFFSARIDPNDRGCAAGTEVMRATAYLNLMNGEVAGGRIVYCSLAAARNSRLVLHELGHTYGLYHSPSPRDVMYCTSGRPPEFAHREALVMNLMRQRRSGNRWPDNDRQAVAPLGTRDVTAFTCGG